jgi:hypothetical protein
MLARYLVDASDKLIAVNGVWCGKMLLQAIEGLEKSITDLKLLDFHVIHVIDA